MDVGFNGPLYILPFDHRFPYAAEVFALHESMTDPQIALAKSRKQIVYRAFQRALAEGLPREQSGILVDESLGSEILNDAREQGILTIVPTEISGHHDFDFMYGERFAEHVTSFRPAFAKVLVPLNPQGPSGDNVEQLSRVRRLMEVCQKADVKLMFELIVSPEPAQLARCGGDRKEFDAKQRPELTVEAIGAIQAAGIEPDVWKLEGLETREDCELVAEAARREGRDRVGCVVLGRGEDRERVRHWLETAAATPGWIGMAVGRSTFAEPILSFVREESSEEDAVSEIASRFRYWIDVFERAALRSQRSPRPLGTRSID